MRFTNLAKTVRKVSGQVAGEHGVQRWEADQVMELNSGVTFFGVVRGKYFITGVGTENLVADIFGSVGSPHNG